MKTGTLSLVQRRVSLLLFCLASPARDRITHGDARNNRPLPCIDFRCIIGPTLSMLEIQKGSTDLLFDLRIFFNNCESALTANN